MIPLNEEKVRDTKAAIARTNNPVKKAALKEELQGWEEWVERWKQRLADAEAVHAESIFSEKEKTDG